MAREEVFSVNLDRRLENFPTPVLDRVCASNNYFPA